MTNTGQSFTGDVTSPPKHVHVTVQNTISEPEISSSTAAATMVSSSSSTGEVHVTVQETISTAVISRSTAAATMVSPEAPSMGDVHVSVQEIISEPEEAATATMASPPSPEEIISGVVDSNSMRVVTPKSRLLDNPTSRSRRMEKWQLLGKDDLPDDYRMIIKCTAAKVTQLFMLILLAAVLTFTLRIEMWRKRRIFGLILWKWEVLLLALISGRLISGLGISLVLLVIERKFLLGKRIVYYICTVRNSVLNCGWSGMVLIVWACIFDKNDKQIKDARLLSYLTRIWGCLLAGTLIWSLKTLGVKYLASSFHVSVFFDRVQEALFTQHAIETLALVGEQKFEGATGAVSGRIFGTSTDSTSKNAMTIDLLHRLTQKNISSWNMKRLIKLVRKGVFLTQHEDDQDITSEHQAKSVAKRIFLTIAKSESKHIFLEDLMRFIPEDEAGKILHLIQEDGAGEEKKISRSTFKRWVVTAYKERKALALSLDDTKTAVSELQKLLNFVVGSLIVVVCLLILKVATTHFLVFLGSQIILAVFMFGNTCKTTFEAIIFLFVMHPFDVGDRVEIDGVQMIVDQMNILTTVFLKFDNLKVYSPNSILATKSIFNFNRSPNMEESIDFSIHISTSGEKISTMKERITRYVDNRSDYWHQAPKILMRDVEDLNKVKFSVWLLHKMNHQDMPERWVRRSLIVEEMVRIFQELDIEYRMLPLDVNLRNIGSSRVPSNWTTCAN